MSTSRPVGCGVARRAFELGIAYSQQRETFGKKIAEHQAVLFRLADMAVKAAHEMMVKAARKKDSGERNDLEAGMAKYLASEYCSQVVEDSFRIHGGYGYSKEYEIERLYREAPMLHRGGHCRHPADDHRPAPARGLPPQGLTAANTTNPSEATSPAVAPPRPQGCVDRPFCQGPSSACRGDGMPVACSKPPAGFDTLST